ncbi:MAG: hypothetical protein DI570_31900 [Phenylobacterium zucineum]|nr:MAG: hypothetical protein DI570_31900 [Phenylobacterium zucineum]
MSSQHPTGGLRPGILALRVVILVAAVVYVWVVVTQVLNGTVFWPSVLASVAIIVVVGGGWWLTGQRERVLAQSDPEAAERYRIRTRRWSLLISAVGLLILGLVLVLLYT